MQTRNRELGEGTTGSAGIILAGYEMLRLRRLHWRRLIDFAVGPAFRLHEFRNSSTRIWRQALCELDCTEPHPGEACGHE